ncbi:hypothetical protein Val02_04590 [Virgisporangium aliadipatigenens]|uniref:Uncharacterized protein n=1 Tax=Virgisporangium aliadipatigenens TaxID=741659 RepID=A0A8J4DNH0_9ACTN|nr:hypothetical protein Val02_04590 [Virgisporangium aliadipatigenens]
MLKCAGPSAGPRRERPAVGAFEQLFRPGLGAQGGLARRDGAAAELLGGRPSLLGSATGLFGEGLQL